MPRFVRRVSGGLAVASAVLCLLLVLIGTASLPDNDFTAYGSVAGHLFCAHTFDGGGGALTLRRFDPWPTPVPFQYHVCSLEGGSDVPRTEGRGASTTIWVDAAGQPVVRRSAGHASGPVTQTVLLRVPILPMAVLTAVPPVAWGAWVYVAARRRRWRERGNRCVTCGYDLRATPAKCPECGRVAAAGANPSFSSSSPPAR